MIDRKLDYIARLFQKTSPKMLESYVISRIWHRLDDRDIKIIPQQYVQRQGDKYALTDLYFPQFKIHIEVNEPAHYKSEDRISRDKIRKVDIEVKTKHEVIVIDCRKDIRQIHDEIDKVVKRIKELKKEQEENGKFQKWQPEVEESPEYWKTKNMIDTENDVSLVNIEDICKLFNADFRKTKKGYLRLGGIKHPEDNAIKIWWPSANRRAGWINNVSDQFDEITEYNIDPKKNEAHFKTYFDEPETRLVFFHSKDVFGYINYKFIGIFAFDQEKSVKEGRTIWKRVGNRVQLSPINPIRDEKLHNQ